MMLDKYGLLQMTKGETKFIYCIDFPGVTRRQLAQRLRGACSNYRRSKEFRGINVTCREHEQSVKVKRIS